MPMPVPRNTDFSSLPTDNLPTDNLPSSGDPCPLESLTTTLINDASVITLPTFTSANPPIFTWGEKDPQSFCELLQAIYKEVVHWRKNCFMIPLGNAGKSFVNELCRLYNAFADASALEGVALMATIVLPILVLQQPHNRSKTKEHISCLERRLKAWKDGDLESLVEEGRAIQHRLPKSRPHQSGPNVARNFANLMFSGKTHAALDLLSNNGKGRILQIDNIN